MYDIFISYRREGGDAYAMLVYERLVAEGYTVFLDIKVLGKGTYDDALQREVEDCRDFLLILSPNALDRCSDPEDFVRREAEWALKAGKRITPIFMRGFSQPKDLPDSLVKVLKNNGVDMANHQYLDAAMELLKTSRLDSRPSSGTKLSKIKRHTLWFPCFSNHKSVCCEACKSTNLEIEDKMMDLITFTNGVLRESIFFGAIVVIFLLLFLLMYIGLDTSLFKGFAEKAIADIPLLSAYIARGLDPGKAITGMIWAVIVTMLPIFAVCAAIYKLRVHYFSMSIRNRVYRAKYTCRECKKEFSKSFPVEELIRQNRKPSAENTDLISPIIFAGIFALIWYFKITRIIFLCLAGLISLFILEPVYKFLKARRNPQTRKTAKDNFILDLTKYGTEYWGMPDVFPEENPEKNAEDTQT